MRALKVTVLAEMDGAAIPGFPFVYSLDSSEFEGFSQIENANQNNAYTDLPVNLLGTIKAFIMQTDNPVILRIDGQSDAGVNLAVGGLLMILGASVTNGITITNNGNNNATVLGLAAGTP